jgi:hypothetical protein
MGGGIMFCVIYFNILKMKNSLDEWLLKLKKIDSTEIMVEYFKGDTNDNKFRFKIT